MKVIVALTLSWGEVSRFFSGTEGLHLLITLKPF